MSRVAVAASSVIAAEAGARIAREGGNAVDAAIAAGMVSLNTEPGVVSLAGGGFVTVWEPGGTPRVFDGGLEMPGRGLAAECVGAGTWEIQMAYGGGVSTVIGHGSVATPGALAVMEASWREHGKLPWKTLIEPAYEHARDGFPLGLASSSYLAHSAEPVFAWHGDSRKALFKDNGLLRETGETIKVPHLDDSLAAIARDGAKAMYTGEIARRIVDDMAQHQGLITAGDLADYQPILRDPLLHQIDDWTIATNPPPAIGGATMCAMLTLMGNRPQDHWSAAEVALAANVQRVVFDYRREKLDLSDDIHGDAGELLDLCGSRPQTLLSPSTIHVSAVDENGLACSLTMSAGYGSGVMPPGTGIWMNNCLGELELNRRGLDLGPPGTRLTSNMAPAIAHSKQGSVLAIGSPGADRITTALMMTLLNLMRLDLTLEDAIEHPRLHVEIIDGEPRIAAEPGIDVGTCAFPVRHFDARSMFFGGVGATLLDIDGQLHAAADSRRTGGARVTV
ncbi:MAG: gamma-glutamyltransferase [Gammaproteobacteria bacterium]|nr:gamma-glutamyltransferase [Gammaproteobacteria bacterium]